MSNQLTCPHCQGVVAIDVALASRMVQCPHCGQQFKMPPIAQPVQPVTQPAMSPIEAGSPGGSGTSSVSVQYRRRKKDATGLYAAGAVVLFLLFVVPVIMCSGMLGSCQQSWEDAGKKQAEKNAQRRKALLKRLSYLKEIEEVAWVEVVGGNKVYVGFREVPVDLPLIVRAAAFQGNKEVDFGVHVWAVPADAKPGDVSRFYGQATARYGKVQNAEFAPGIEERQRRQSEAEIEERFLEILEEE